MTTKPKNRNSKAQSAKSAKAGGNKRSAVRSKPTPTPAPKPRKSTQAQVTERVNIVWGLLASGARRAEIVQYGSEKWGVTDRQTDDYIAAATVLIKAEADKTREEAFPAHVAIRQQIFKRAMGDEDWQSALAAARDEAKLRDLYPAEKRKIEGTIITTNVTADEMAQARAKAKALEQQLAQDAAQFDEPSVGKPDAP